MEQTRHAVSLRLLCGILHLVIMPDFLMPETQQTVIVIIIYNYTEQCTEVSEVGCGKGVVM